MNSNLCPALLFAGLLMAAAGMKHGARAQEPSRDPERKAAANTPAVTGGTELPRPVVTAEPGSQPRPQQPNSAPVAGSPAPAPNSQSPQAGAGDPGAPASPDEIQLSFQGANIEMVVQWLAKTTGKSVIKHPRVQCQITIVSSKSIATREALNLVYRALTLEGFTTIESSKSILIVPEGQDTKMSPELIQSTSTTIPEGRQRLIKVFPLKHIQAGELREKIKAVLTEKATIDLDERSNQVIVTDFNDSLRLIGELVKELDVPSAGDSIIEIIPLKYLEADELANLVGLILNAQSAPPSSTSSPRGSAGGSRPMPGGPPEMSMGGPPSSPGGGGGSQTSGMQIRLWPDKTSNRLIVATPKSRLPEIKRLIDLLDTQKPADVSIRVIALKNMTAEDLVKEIAPLYAKIGGRSVKEAIEITANTRSNSLMILSSEANFKMIEKLILTLDTEDAQEKTMQAFTLKNADAEDVAKQLKDLTADQDTRSSRYFYYFQESNSKNSKKVSIVADRRRNTVVVQGPPAAMEGIAMMVAKLDEPVGDDSLAPRIFKLKFVSAVDIEDVLNELFLKKQPQRTYWDYFDGPPETEHKDVGRLYGKIRITSEPYSNSIIVTANSTESMAALEEVLKQLDSPSEAGETTLRVNLRFAQSIAVANNLNILFARGGSPALRPPPAPGAPVDQRRNQQPTGNSQTDFELERETKEEAYFPWLGGPQENQGRSGDGRNVIRPVSDLVGRVRVVPDKRANAVLVSANVHFFPQVLKLLNEMDAPTAQVLIEAKIVEVSSDFRDKLGVRWSADGKRTFSAEDLDGSLLANGTGSYNKVFAGSALAESLKTGILDTRINLDVLVQFLRKNTDSTVLAEPQINIADNELGKLFVGSQVPFISGSLNTDVGGRNDTFQYKDVGIILEVTPHINNSEDVALKIRAESSSIRSGETLFGGAIIDTRNFRTDLNVKSGQTIVLGGIIQKEQSNVTRKVPVLGSIPGLGWAFKKKDKVSRDVELMVFLKPKVTRTPEQAKELLSEIERRLPRIVKSQEEDQKEREAAAEKKK